MTASVPLALLRRAGQRKLEHQQQHHYDLSTRQRSRQVSPANRRGRLVAVVRSAAGLRIHELGHQDRRIPIFLTTCAVSSEQRTGYDYVVADGILDEQVSYAVGIGEEAFTVLHGRCRCAFAANPHVNPSCSPCWITDVAWLILGRGPIAASIFDDEVTTDVRNVEDGPGWVVERVYTAGDAMSYG
jgi:hypothetical protein